MNNNENKVNKTFMYRLGQLLAVVTVLCLMSLIIGFTVATLFRLF